MRQVRNIGACEVMRFFFRRDSGFLALALAHVLNHLHRARLQARPRGSHSHLHRERVSLKNERVGAATTFGAPGVPMACGLESSVCSVGALAISISGSPEYALAMACGATAITVFAGTLGDINTVIGRRSKPRDIIKREGGVPYGQSRVAPGALRMIAFKHNVECRTWLGRTHRQVDQHWTR